MAVNKYLHKQNTNIQIKYITAANQTKLSTRTKKNYTVRYMFIGNMMVETSNSQATQSFDIYTTFPSFACQQTY